MNYHRCNVCGWTGGPGVHHVCSPDRLQQRLARLNPDGSYEPIGDARAQLWARVYADELAALHAVHRAQPEPSFRDQPMDVLIEWTRERESIPGRARKAADAAVADFDEHYLGGKR